MPGFLKVFPPTYREKALSPALSCTSHGACMLVPLRPPNMPAVVADADYLEDAGMGWDECNRFSARLFEDTILNEDPSTIAGIIVEPIGNTGGLITPTVEYFEIIRDICDRHDVALIFDETITGFCKTGNMFCAETWGITPDLIVTGKGVSNGVVPLAAMIARADMADCFLKDDQSFFAHGHTFANNPLACAVTPAPPRPPQTHPHTPAAALPTPTGGTPSERTNSMFRPVCTDGLRRRLAQVGSAVLDVMVEERLDLKARVLGEVLSARLHAMKEDYGEPPADARLPMPA